GNIERVGATVAGVAVAGEAGAIRAEFERRQPRLIANLCGSHLIARDTNLDVRARSLARVGAGEEGRRGPRVIAGAVAVGTALVVGEAGEDEQVFLVRLERFENERQLEVRADGLGG